MLKTRKLLRRGLIIDGTNKGTCLQATKYWTAIDFPCRLSDYVSKETRTQTVAPGIRKIDG